MRSGWSKQLRDQGQSAFVMPVKSGGATLYRVRIGPMKDRASAEAALRDVKAASAASGAAKVVYASVTAELVTG